MNRRWLYLDRRRLGINAAKSAKTDQILRANERSVVLQDHAISRIDVSQLAANQPVEDFFSGSKCLASNAYLLGVFDGHAGAACARHVSTRLYDYYASAILPKHLVSDIPLGKRLQWLFSNAEQKLPLFEGERHEKNVEEFYKKFKADREAATVRKAIQAAFLALDTDLSNGAMPDSQGRVNKANVNVATSGACTLVSRIRNSHLHVANIGDSAAVLGVNHPINGIVARLLSRPHCVENVDEINRIRAAHPLNESATILKSGRLLSELYPLRAFGDVRYKWPLTLQRVVLGSLGMPPPMHLLTPPYLTAQPEVFYHQLTLNDKFLVMATDGLWEWLDPDTVVRLVNDHTLGAQTLTHFQPSPNADLSQVLRDLAVRKQGHFKKPLDENSATHLIRNALGGCAGGVSLQYTRLAESLQLPPGTARNFRDDITVVVVHFNSDYLTTKPPDQKPSCVSS